MPNTPQEHLKTIKAIVGVLREHNKNGKPLGFRVITQTGVTVDVSIDELNLKIPNALNKLQPIPIFWDGSQHITMIEKETGESIPDHSSNTALVESLQYHIYLLERQYRQENSTNIFEVIYEFPYKGKVTHLSGYLQAQDERHANGTGKSYIAQTYGVKFHDILCLYVSPHYEPVEWGAMSPLLAIRLTIDKKWNKTILPKLKKYTM